MLGLTFDKLLLIALLAAFLLGPHRLPAAAQGLARTVKAVKRLADETKDRVREEMGPEFDEVDWKKLDPRQYDPRRIIREALLEDEEPAPQVVRPSARVESPAAKRARLSAERSRVAAENYATVHTGPAPFDSEAP